VKLLIVYCVFLTVGEFVAYGVGRVVENWSEPASMPAFLTLFFLMFWVAWKAALKVA
jgi:hypothetical protein